MSRSLVLAATLVLSLAACQQPAQESASAAPDAADVAKADVQSPDAGSSTHALPLKKPSATDVPMPGTTAPQAATVGAAGFGAVRFGMSRSEAGKAIGGGFDAPAQDSCQQVHRAGQPGVSYMFEGDKLLRIDVRAPGVMADGGGRVGMQVDDIRALYAGRLKEQPSPRVQGGVELKIASKDGGIVFETDANGAVTAFHAGVGAALDRGDGCS